MPQEPKKWVIVLIGAPGAGKGTQAELLAEDFGLLHLETSKIIEEKLNAADTSNADMMHERELFKTGKLNSADKVLKWTMEKTEEHLKSGAGIVFSASPRTLFEAKNEIPYFGELYGKENVKIVHIKVPLEVSIERNSHRRICAANRHPIPNFPQYKDIDVCPKDGSELVKRILDTPETIKVRYATYLEETETPILGFLREINWEVLDINGQQSIEAVHDDIIRGLDGLHASMHLKILAKNNDS